MCIFSFRKPFILQKKESPMAISDFTNVERNFQAQDGATPAQDTTITDRNLDNFRVPVNALLDQKRRLFN